VLRDRAQSEEVAQEVPVEVWRTAARYRHGGCFLSSVASEFDGRPGPVRDAVLDALASWSAYVAAELGTAVETRELPPRTDVGQLVFELNGVALAANQSIQLHRDPQAPTRARRAIARLLIAP
jgi:hypothetical protein